MMDMLKHSLVFTALVVALSSGGCMWIEKETIEDLEQAVEDMETAIRRYHVEVLFPALAAATEAERKRYREILDNRDAQCGTEAPRFGRRGWDQCLMDIDRKAAAVLGIEPFGGYWAKAGKPGPQRVRASLPKRGF